MDYAQVFVDSNKQHRLEGLMPLTEELYAQYKVDKCSFEQWKTEIQKLGYELSKFRVDVGYKSFFDRFFYIGDYATVSFPTIDLDWLSIDLNKDQLRRNQIFKELFEEGNYAFYFFPENNSFAIDYFIRHFDKIPEDARYEVFKDLYVYLETSFELFPKQLVEQVLKSAPRKEVQLALNEAGKVNDCHLTVYRGMMENSTPLESALSWTLSLEKAKMFASRDRKYGEVYQGAVELQHVIDYLQDRDEEEVWLEHGKVSNITKLEI